jgi:hypothetical protein
MIFVKKKDEEKFVIFEWPNYMLLTDTYGTRYGIYSDSGEKSQISGAYRYQV